MRALPALLALALTSVVGCASSPLRVYDDPAGAPTAVAEPPSGTQPAGAMCLFAWSETTYYGMTGWLERSGYKFLTSDDYDAKGCDALVLVHQTGSSAFGTSFVDVYAPYGGEKVLQVQAEGGWGPVFGFERAGRYLQAELRPGTGLRKKLDAARAEKPLLTPEEIASLAGPAALTWDLLTAWESDPAKHARLETMAAAAKAKSAAAAASVARAATETAASEESADDEDAAPAPSDIDALPAASAARPHSYAVVIGIERYREKLPKADFAAGDAKLAARYFERALGVPEANVAVLTDDRATKGDFEKYFERWLPNRVEAGDTVYVYYSGHGAPNPSRGDSYLVPFDGDPTYIDQTGFAVKRMLDDLAKLPAKQVFVAMDSCFSGAGGRSVIAKGARPLVTVTQSEVPSKVTVLSASAGDQISNSYQEKGHGLFTYFLLKGLKERGGDLRAAFDYSKPEVARTARREYNADQEPQWREGR